MKQKIVFREDKDENGKLVEDNIDENELLNEKFSNYE